MTDAPTTIRLFGTATDSIVDGVGLRFAVFTQGCPHRCEGCHNPESHAMDGGYEAKIADVVAEIAANKLIGGVTLSGGDPLMQSEASLELARQVKALGLNLWLYSGFLYEDISAGKLGEAAVELLEYCDVLVDGPFVQNLHHYELRWKGSSNQRVIDLDESKKQGKVILWEQQDDLPQPPPSW